MREKVLSLVLIVVFVLSMTSFAIEDSLDAITVSYVSYTASAVAITKLTAGQTVTISATVINKNTNNIELILSTALKRNGVFENVATDKKIAVAEFETVYSASMTMPADVTGCILETTIWQDFAAMKPLCNLGTFPSSNANLTKIALNGETIAGFSNSAPTYTKQYPKGTFAIPTVSYQAEDNSTRVTSTNSVAYPATFNISSVAASAVDKKDFKLDVTRVPFVISNLKVEDAVPALVGGENARRISVGGDFNYLSPPNAPVDMHLWVDRGWAVNASDKTTAIAEYVKNSTLTEAGKAFIAESGTIVKVPVVGGKDTTLPTVPWYSFEIEQTAEVCVVMNTFTSTAVDADWINRGWKVKYNENLFTMTNQMVSPNTFHGAWFGKVYAKTFTVVPGQTAKVEINNAGASLQFGYFIVVRYKEN